MAGRKFGAIMAAKVPGSYFTLTEAEQAAPGKAVEEVMAKYADKVSLVRRYWTSAFTAEVSDVFVLECDDLMDLHDLSQEMTRVMAKSGDPDSFGETVSIWVGVNPDEGSD